MLAMWPSYYLLNAHAFYGGRRWEAVGGANSLANSKCLLRFARDRLNTITHEALGLDLATDALWEFLRGQPTQELTLPKTWL
jgi:hypothetical protein